jgi:hypothetical protein
MHPAGNHAMPTTNEGRAGGGAGAGAGSVATVSADGNGLAAVSSGAAQDLEESLEAVAQQGGVGYCMMTFIIRNGLAALRTAPSAYLAFCDNQARKIGLGPKHAAQVRGGAVACLVWKRGRVGVSAWRGR